jgi:hypothetical protein
VKRHGRSDGLVGTPLCFDCYDYVGAVLHNASTPELWRGTMIYTQRHLVAVLECTQSDLARSYAYLCPGDLRDVTDAMDLAPQSARVGAVTLPTGQISRGDFAGTSRPAEYPSET